MPGKQMAIDADLNTGIMTESEAKLKRENIAREAEFYGAMDGASKFVKGDAIAGILINAINIIGGFIIGVAQRGMGFEDAIQTYTILTIGDGLVSQIPALIIATGSGLVVTRSAAGTALDFQMKSQLLGNKRVLATVSGVVILFGLVPGMPTIPFMILGTLLGISSYMKRKKGKDALNDDTPAEEVEAEIREETFEKYLQVDPIEVEIGYGLISLVDEDKGGDLFNKISSTRKFIALEYGVLIPPVRVRDNLQLDPNEYIIKIKGNIVANYEIHTDRYLAMNPGDVQESVSGLPTTDPAFGLEAYWVNEEEKEKAELVGLTVVDGLSVLSTHLQETLKKNFDKILTRQTVKQLLENLKTNYSAVIDDIDPEVLPLGTIQKVLQALLKEYVPIKDLVQILEALIDYSKVTKNVDVLTEYCRHSIGETIGNIYKDNHGIIHCAVIGENLDSVITESLQNHNESSQNLGLYPRTLKELNNNIKKASNKFMSLGFTPVVLCSATIRPYFYRLINSSFPDFAVLSFSELPANVEIEFIEKIEVSNEN
jgi:flagellar biosynthesis protein FlhA